MASNYGLCRGVFTQFVALCQGAGPARCVLARHPETVAQRVARLFRQDLPQNGHAGRHRAVISV